MRTERFRCAMLSALVIASLMVLAISLLSVSPSSAVPEGLTPRTPIYIEGNARFTPGNGVNGGGSGVENDPYIIENWDISAENARGIWIKDTTAHFIIRNCYVHDGRDNGNEGIWLVNVMNGKIDNVLLNNNYYGISLVYYSINNLISNNVVKNSPYGIRIDFSSNTLIENNVLENHSYGISILSSDNNTLNNNTYSNNDYCGIYLGYSSNNLISNNIGENNSFYGINLYKSGNNRISNNLAENNSWDGITLDSSDNNIIFGNTVGNNFRGIFLYYSDNNLIYHNNLTNNTNQARDNGSNTWDNGYPWGGNYWSDYTGADENHGENQDIPGSDGIGDTPYYISGDSNQDRYPLMESWAPVIPATIDINPNTLNLKSMGGWITCSIELPEGYDVADIDTGSIRLNGVVPAEPRQTGISGKKLMVKFSRSAVQAIVGMGEVELTVTGLVNSTPFEGNDTIRVIKPGKADLEMRFTEMPLEWAMSPPKGKLEIEIEFSEIPFYWALAPD